MDLARAILKIRPGAVFSLNDNDYEKLEWLDKRLKKPSLKELEDAWLELESEIVKFAVESKRIEAYRNISDPLFFEYQRGDATKKEWLDSVAKIKKQFPYSK